MWLLMRGVAEIPSCEIKWERNETELSESEQTEMKQKLNGRYSRISDAENRKNAI